MRVPERLIPLLDQGVIQEVVRPLMSGKEAQVYLVRAGPEERVAKVYKEASQRSFRNRAEYQEGRKVRSSREQRALDRHSRYGRELEEEAWHSAEVDALHALERAGVRVPQAFDFVDGVLVMELVRDVRGQPAPRLTDLPFTRDEARALFHHLLREVVRMLCAGVVHADLSEFNVLMGADGPVVIDFPQAVDAASNRNARKLLVRDVNNLVQFFGRWVPELRGRAYGQEMWALYEKGELTVDSPLTGRWNPPQKRADGNALLAEIMAMEQETRARREALGLPPPRPARTPVTRTERPAQAPPAPPSPVTREGGQGRRSRRRRG